MHPQIEVEWSLILSYPVFVGSGIFLSGDPVKRARAIVQSVTHFNNPKVSVRYLCILLQALIFPTPSDLG